MGVTIEAPFMTLSFLALSVIPSLKITDRGLVDVDAFALVPLALNGRIELSREAFVARFGALYEHSPWVAEEAWRPSFAGLDELAAALRDAMYAAPRDAQLALIRAHPDLGEKVGVLTEHSASEQAGLGLDRLPPEAHARFMATNAAYRERFGIPFVVCVREHGSAESILANADSRLGNTHRAGDRDGAGRDRQDRAAAAGGRAVSTLSTHVLDTVRGRPAAGVAVELRRGGGLVASLRTDDDGRARFGEVAPGSYELEFAVGDYFGEAPFLDVVPIRFTVSEESTHYHVPLLGFAVGVQHLSR